MSAYTLQQISQRSHLERKNLKIIRVEDQSDPDKHAFWFSGFENVKTRLFSVEDLNSLWLILDEEKRPKP